MKFSELRNKTLEELRKMELELKDTLFAKRLAKNIVGSKFIKRGIARIKTMITNIKKEKI
ncbi:50S ribosomal protein L29 [Candidatus Fokinia crypta]|uniref:Large ribosomal subunit protein uL29 n=1 Tax=Candidatus Fokinia crypta TaxID=1920990 RepID=A0ABZ0UNS4_9RICK|nr:50S ribosomal protein L29 [Candidatus Fokinia cryptica]WPX97778.1 50S ribosomal protein L29 [Candidatus Fokinia cryptica]